MRSSSTEENSGAWPTRSIRSAEIGQGQPDPGSSSHQLQRVGAIRADLEVDEIGATSRSPEPLADSVTVDAVVGQGGHHDARIDDDQRSVAFGADRLDRARARHARRPGPRRGREPRRSWASRC